MTHEDWPGAALADGSDGFPLTHDILDRLGLLAHASEHPDDAEAIEEHGSDSQGSTSSSRKPTRRASFSSEPGSFFGTNVASLPGPDAGMTSCGASSASDDSFIDEFIANGPAAPSLPASFVGLLSTDRSDKLYDGALYPEFSNINSDLLPPAMDIDFGAQDQYLSNDFNAFQASATLKAFPGDVVDFDALDQYNAFMPGFVVGNADVWAT